MCVNGVMVKTTKNKKEMNEKMIEETIIKICIIIFAGILLGLVMRKVNKFASKNIRENTEYKLKIEFYED